MPLYKPSNPDVHVTSQFSLKGKNAAVTGGVRGIGLAASKALAEAGANVAILYTSTKDAEEIAAKLASETGVTVKAYKASVENKDEITTVLNTVASDFGSLDIVVANAGIASHHPAEDYTEDQWRAIMNVNLDGAFWTAQAAGNIFKKQGRGNLIFTASVSAILVNVPQKQAAYNASKAGVVQLARCLSVEWVDFARVNCISPGFIATDMLAVHPQEWREKWFSMIPANRLCDPAELKGAYVFLASDASTYMTGANIVIDGGYTLP
ncbi:oxidoreductase [Cucurbitaria berberidis CBS 394.84]|uniref:NADP-dependent mannitol dehydrogenase n=1 Tax=Cucurbitaria berberidis CBS 394.84 TaxID=1168544 RepID=A0A9P4GNT7_9PLEO|nr:oxidoreductase [Cucurbitaria berberidis CBS 394.84]KAF1849077.1 oxidoreductase [Cucurbitaria berberidis CBS 394.84]